MYGLYKLRGGCLLALCGVLVTACSFSPATPTRVLESYGKSVDNMIAEQTYEPGDEVEDLDGNKARVVLETYRQDVAAPKKIDQPIIQVNLD